MQDNGWSLRELYKSLETPGENRLRDAHAALDAAVRRAYGMKPDEDILAFLLKLNLELAEKETKGEPITPARPAGICGEPKRGSSTFLVELEFTLALTADVFPDFPITPEETCFISSHPLKISRNLNQSRSRPALRDQFAPYLHLHLICAD